eukprot:748761-Hanusia_phi.AAC.2
MSEHLPAAHNARERKLRYGIKQAPVLVPAVQLLPPHPPSSSQEQEQTSKSSSCQSCSAVTHTKHAGGTGPGHRRRGPNRRARGFRRNRP